MSEQLNPIADPTVIIDSLLANVEPKLSWANPHEAIENIWCERQISDGSLVQISTSSHLGYPKEYELLHRQDSADPNFEIWKTYNLTDQMLAFSLLKKDKLLLSTMSPGENRLAPRPFTEFETKTVFDLLKSYQDAQSAENALHRPPRFERLKEIGRKALETLGMFAKARKY